MSKGTICAICGERVATTRDHVPPKGIFPKPFPENLITVPACQLCNNGANQADEQFRTYLSMTIRQDLPEAKNLWKNRSLRTLNKNKKLFRAVSEGLRRAPAYTDDGVYLGEKPVFLWPANVYEPIIERIARGLYYKHYNEVLGSRAACEVGFLYSLPTEAVQLTRTMSQVQIGEGIFTYRYGRDADKPLNSLWIFEFYLSHWAYVETKPANPNKGFNRTRKAPGRQSRASSVAGPVNPSVMCTD